MAQIWPQSGPNYIVGPQHSRRNCRHEAKWDEAVQDLTRILARMPNVYFQSTNTHVGKPELARNCLLCGLKCV